MNRSSFGETTAGWIVNASWAWPASYWRSWIWQTWWLAGTSFSPPPLWWTPRWRRWSATPHNSLWRAPWGRAVNAHKTNYSTWFIFLWKGSHSPPDPKSAGRAWLQHRNPLECSRISSEQMTFLEYSRIDHRGNALFQPLRKRLQDRQRMQTRRLGFILAFNTLACDGLYEETSSI